MVLANNIKAHFFRGNFRKVGWATKKVPGFLKGNRNKLFCMEAIYF
jgi:hypothetical protein